MIANNLVFALVIDYFLDEYSKDLEEQKEEEDRNVLRTGRNFIFDSNDLPTNRELGRYVAQLRPKYRQTESASKKIMRDLFVNRAIAERAESF